MYVINLIGPHHFVQMVYILVLHKESAYHQTKLVAFYQINKNNLGKLFEAYSQKWMLSQMW